MPSLDSPTNEWTSPHRILPPTEDYHSIRLEVTPESPETAASAKSSASYFETPDLESLTEALRYGDTFPVARERALRRVREVVGLYRGRIWRPCGGVIESEGRGEGEGREGETAGSENEAEGSIREEVLEMVRLLCIQEARLLDYAWDTLNKEIPQRD